jgi:hypothetical protein
MALKICQFYQLDVHDFISMLSDEELGRQDYSVIKAHEKTERKKAEALKAKVIGRERVSTGGSVGSFAVWLEVVLAFFELQLFNKMQKITVLDKWKVFRIIFIVSISFAIPSILPAQPLNHL